MKILVLALGNDILGDDSAGYIVADKLSSNINSCLKNKVDIVKTAETGLYLFDYFLLDYDYVIIIDSVVSNEEGRVYNIPIEALKPATAPSPHYSGIPEILGLLEGLDYKKPYIYIYAITIREPEIGGDVSKKVVKAAETLAKIILNQLSSFLTVSDCE